MEHQETSTNTDQRETGLAGAEGSSPFFDSLENRVFVEKCYGPNGLAAGLSFGWSRRGIGFGVITLTVGPNGLEIDHECMDVDFCLDVIRQAITEAEARSSNVPHQP